MISAAAAPLALLAALLFGAALVLTQFGLRHIEPGDGALVSIPTTAALFWAASPFAVGLGGWRTTAAAIFAAVGVVFPAVVTMLTYQANRHMGPTVAGAVGGTTPLFATGAAIAVLHERPGAMEGAAMLLIVAGVAALSWRKTGAAMWSVRLLWLPLTAAALRGAAQTAIKLGLAIWPDGFVAALIGYTVSAASVALVAGLRGRERRPALTPRGALWFALVGVCNGAAVWSTYAALRTAPVSMVASVVASYPLFTLVFSVLTRIEPKITPRLVLGTVLTVVGIAGLLRSG